MALLEKAKIDVNEIIYYPANNNYVSDNVGIFATINFTGDELLLDVNTFLLKATESGNNDLNHKDWCTQDNIDVRFSQYLNDNLIGTCQSMKNYLDRKFWMNGVQFSPL